MTEAEQVACDALRAAGHDALADHFDEAAQVAQSGEFGFVWVPLNYEPVDAIAFSTLDAAKAWAVEEIRNSYRSSRAPGSVVEFVPRDLNHIEVIQRLPDGQAFSSQFALCRWRIAHTAESAVRMVRPA